MGALLLLAGCVSSRYKPADKDAPAALPMNLVANVAPDAEGEAKPMVATLNTVLYFKGPGAWKREAFWDEYVLTLTNPGETSLVLESATLTDFRGDATTAGDNPWTLESQSRSRAEAINRIAKTTLVQIGAGYTMAGVAASAAFLGGGVAALAIFPIYVAGAVYRNVSSRHEIEAEFARRRMLLPLTLAPHQTVQGSLFFRIAPSPKNFSLRFRSGTQPMEANFDLSLLAGLHLKTKPATETPPK